MKPESIRLVAEAIFSELGREQRFYQSASNGLVMGAARAAVSAVMESEEVRELREAAKQFDQTYGWHWDRVDGAAVVLPDRVEELDARYDRLHEALSQLEAGHAET